MATETQENAQLDFDVPERHAAWKPLLSKLARTAQRHADLQERMNDPAVLSDPGQLMKVSRESGQLAGRAETFRSYAAAANELADLREMAGDPEMAEMAEADLPRVEQQLDNLMEQAKAALVEADEPAVGRFFMEIRAGTGGEEAALFARDLFEMYRKFAEIKGFKFSVDDFSDSERGGFKEVVVSLQGDEAYKRLRYEGGGHRVQRVPETETQGRIHTSAATVAVLPELDDVEVTIEAKDIEEGGCRGGGPGGQNVNKVETGWRITHKPSGLQFKITEQKSQAQNKERAWALLRAALYERERSQQLAEQSASRKAMMGSGDRSQRVRTYNFPQNRCTDHRLGGSGDDDAGTKNFPLEKVMNGDLDPLADALSELDRQQRLAEL
ncbi:MAG: PCRF domain-containing protein [Planctomycetota bacterium]